MTLLNSSFSAPAHFGAWLAVLALLASPAAFASDTSTTADGADWPQFRGLERNGISAETGLLDTWPDGGPPEIWRQPLGEGYSGITVVGDRIYTMFAADVPAGDGEGEAAGREYAAAFDRDSGEELWRVEMGDRHDTEFGNGPRSTPTVAGETVFVLGSLGRLAALSTADGTVKWQKDLTTDFGAERPHWGFSTSALADGDHLIVEAGGKDGRTLVALDQESGEQLWALGDQGASYNSPLRIERGDDVRYVHLTGGKLFSVDAKGKEVWSYEWPRGETHALSAGGVDQPGAGDDRHGVGLAPRPLVAPHLFTYGIEREEFAAR
ncbi:MAG: PQQ-binding-like beta-propeller repeat protein, partial [Acidobacteriota bacterium]